MRRVRRATARKERRYRGSIRALARGLTVALLAVAVSTLPKPAGATVPIRCYPNSMPLALGNTHSVALDTAGTTKTWGDNWAGQLGDGGVVPYSISPITPAGLSRVVGLSAGGDHNLAVTAEGDVYAWGYNEYGQIGNGVMGNYQAEPSPVKVTGLSEVVAVSAGGGHSLALTEDGTVFGWGRNDEGQVGDGTILHSAVPVQVVGLTDVVAIAAGGYHSVAVKSDGSVWAWGDNISGQVGNGASDAWPHPVPERVKTASGNLGGITAVSAGGWHTLAVKNDATVWAWGENSFSAALGDGTYTDRPYAVKTTDHLPASATAVAAGWDHSLARLSDGRVFSWGYGYSGELGLGVSGFSAYTNIPNHVSTISGITLIAAGGSHSAAVTSDGTIYVWGWNAYGQLGLSGGSQVYPQTLPSVSQSTPAAPTEVEAVAGDKLAFVTWEAPSSAVTQYVITPYANGVAQAPVGTDSPKTEFAVAGLTAGVTYDFEVAAQNCLGTGPVSASKSNRVVPTDVQLQEQGFSLERQRINDRHALSVNVFNGNLKLTATDLAIAGTGLLLSMPRIYNSRATTSGAFGNAWSTPLGIDAFIEKLDNGSVYLHTGDGSYLGFGKNDDGTYDSPAGIDATLTRCAGTLGCSRETYTLRFHFTGEQWQFSANETWAYCLLNECPAQRYLRTRKDRNGNQLSFAYDSTTKLLTTVTDTHGRQLTFTHDANNRVSEIEDFTGRTWAYGYDASGNLTSYTDPRGTATPTPGDFTTTYGYDASGRLTTITTPGGGSAGTRQVAFTYDGSNRVQTLAWPQAPGSPTTSLDYQTLTTVVTDANGNDTRYEFDEVGRTKKVIDALGNSVSTDYTSNSNVKRHSIGGATTTYGYSSVNALTSVNYATGSGYTLAYDDPVHPNLPTTVSDPQGNALSFAYDSAGSPVSMTDQLPADNQVTAVYNSRGLPTRTTDPVGTTNGTPTAYGYTFDAGGHMTAGAVTPPSPLGPISVSFDALSRPTSVADGKGQATSYQYDPLDRLTDVTYADGTTVEYAYDGDGNAVAMTDASGTTTMEYDERNLLASRTTPDGNTIEYEYDGMGNLESVTEDGKTTLYSYSASNLLSSVTGPDGKATVLSYDADFNRVAVRYPNRVSLFSVYDEAKRLTRISAVDQDLSPLLRFDYSYNHPTTGNDTALRQSVTDLEGNTTTYTYDVLNRLTKARTTTASGVLTREEEYRYDGNSNRTSQTIYDGMRVRHMFFRYNAANELVNHNGTATWSYDGNGNWTGSSLGDGVGYNAANQTLSMRTTKGLAAEFDYVGPSQVERVGVSVVDAGVAEVSVSGFSHSVLGVSSETTAGAGTTYYVRDDQGRLLSQHGPAGVHYYLPDGLGSTAGLADKDGRVLATYAYDAFGNVTRSGGADALSRFRFAGEYLDPTGFYKMGHRYYDPALGRFTQQDPIYNLLNPKLWNRYVYVGGDPVNFVDPSGLSTCGDWSLGGLVDCGAKGARAMGAAAKCTAEVLSDFMPWNGSTGSVIAEGGALVGTAGVGIFTAGVALPASYAAVASGAIVLGGAAIIAGFVMIVVENC